MPEHLRKARSSSSGAEATPAPPTVRGFEPPPPAHAPHHHGHSISRISVFAPQTKLTVNTPGDRYEQEADAVADSVMGMTAARSEGGSAVSPAGASPVQRQMGAGTPPAAPSAPPDGPDVSATVSRGLSGGGQALDAATRAFMEPRLGHDFSQVRVHTSDAASQSAEQVSARAYALGSDIAFRSGEYQPGSDTGRRLLAHELTHVVQQTGLVSRDTTPAAAPPTYTRDELLKAYQAALAAGNMAEAAMRLNGFNDWDIQDQVKKLSGLNRRGMYFAAPKWDTRVPDAIALIDPKVKESAAVTDAQLDQIQKGNPNGVTVALYAAYDYGDTATKQNNAAFPLEAGRFAGNEGAVGLAGGNVTVGAAIPITAVEDVVTTVQSIHRGLVDKWRSSQTPPPAADAEPPAFTRIHNLALFAHGMSYGIGMDKHNAFNLKLNSVKAFVAGLTGVVVPNVRVQLFSCNAGLSQEDGKNNKQEWGKPEEGGRKGADSFAATLAGALGPDASVYAHTAAAHTTELSSARVFGHDAGGGEGGLHIFDLLYDAAFIQSEMDRLFPATDAGGDRTALHARMRSEMWTHYQHRMFDFVKVKQADGTEPVRGVPKTYKPGEHTLGQDQFAETDQAKAGLHQDWTDNWIKDPAHLANVAPKTPVTPVQRQIQRTPDLTIQRAPPVPTTPAPTTPAAPTLDPNDTEPGWPPGKTAKNHHWDKIETFPLAAQISADLLAKPEFAPKAPVVLNGYWIKDIFAAVRLIKDKHHALDALEAQAPPKGAWPRVGAVVALVKDPLHFDFDSYLAGLSAEDKKAFQEPDPDHPGQFRANAQVGEMKTFQAESHLRQWPTLLRPGAAAAAAAADALAARTPGGGTPGAAAGTTVSGGGGALAAGLNVAPLTPAQVKDLCKAVADNRAKVPVRKDLHDTHPAGGTYHAGLYHTRSKADLKAGKEVSPQNTAEKYADGQAHQNPLQPEAPPSAIDPARTRVNNLAWQEVLTEGSAASVNTYDSQLLTVGRGFGASGPQGRDVLTTVFASDPLARDLMLDVGFTVDGGKSLALDVNTGKVVEGDAALRLIELNKPIFSQFINTFEDNPDHQQEMVNAQFSVLRRNAADIPEQVYSGGVWTEGTFSKTLTAWDDNVIRFGVHLNHFASGISWPVMIRDCTDSSGKGDILKLGRKIAAYCAPREVRGSATLLSSEQNRILEWGEGVLPAALPAAAALPANVDTVSAYFLLVGGDKYRQLNK